MIMLKLKPNILCKYDHALYKLSLAYVTPPALSPLPTFRVRSTCTHTNFFALVPSSQILESLLSQFLQVCT